jgi:hypothetical protein
MKLFTRRNRPPTDIVTAVGSDDRVLSWADTDSGSVVAASMRGLWWPRRDGPRLIGWQLIDKVTWSSGVLSVIEAEVVEDFLLVDKAAVIARLTVPRDLPPTIRKRVEANIVRSELLTVGGGAVRFVARRQPGENSVTWWARLEGGTPDNDRVRSAVRARLSILRAAESQN